MVQFLIIVFLGIPLIFTSLLLCVSLCRCSTIFSASSEAPQPVESLPTFSEPGLSRRELNRIVSEVRRNDKRRKGGSRPIYFFA